MKRVLSVELAASGDVAIAVTYSGDQKEVAEALKKAREHRAFSCFCGVRLQHAEEINRELGIQ